MRLDFDYLSLNAEGRSGRDFERYVRHLLDVLGFRNIHFTGAEPISEYGIDFEATRDVEIFPGIFEPRIWGVQCKCVRSPRLPPIIEQLGKAAFNRGLRDLLLVFAGDPSDQIMQGAQSWATKNNIRLEIWGKTQLDSFAQRFLSARRWLLGGDPQAESVDDRYFPNFYHLGPNYARAARLAGADSEWFPPDRLHLSFDDSQYQLPKELELQKPKIVRRLEIEAQAEGRMFYDGPNTRLVKFRASPTDSEEKKDLELHVGRIGWYDYSVFSENLGRALSMQTVSAIADYVDLDRVILGGDLRGNRLTNIVDVAATIVSADGMITFCRRSTRVSATPGNITSSVAENIHEHKDLPFATTPMSATPAPFNTVLRGIREEISPAIADRLSVADIFLLGLCFDLNSFGHDLLFLVTCPLTASEMFDMAQEFPGKDFLEGELQTVPANRSSQEMTTVLNDPNWNPGGKASFIRTIEFLEAHSDGARLNVSQVVDKLHRGEVT